MQHILHIREMYTKINDLFEKADTLGLKIPQAIILITLADNNEVNQRELGFLCKMDRSTMAEILARMERKGLIDKYRSIFDQREYIIKLTDKGKEYAEITRKIINIIENHLTSLDNYAIIS